MNDDPLMQLNARPQLTMLRGDGSYLHDETGKAYLDFVQGWAVNALGHCAREVRDALTTQSGHLLTPSPAYHNAPARELARRLVDASGLGKATLCSSGAEANECACKLARKWGRVHRAGASDIITTRGAFHGRTLALMTASGKPGWDDMFPPNIPGFPKVAFGDAEAVARAIDERTCAVMVEPIQGEAGVVLPPPGYLNALRRITKEAGTLLIFDEIQTGMGRTGTMFRFEAEDATPDILTLGKGLGGGVPLAAVVSSEPAACFEAGEHGGTYAGNPLMASVGIAVFDAIRDEGFLARVRRAGTELTEGLLALSNTRSGAVMGSVRGAGLLQAAILRQPIAARVVERAREVGLLLNAPRSDVLRFMPSLRVSRGEIHAMLDLLKRALALETAGE